MKKVFKMYEITPFDNFRQVLEYAERDAGDKTAFLYTDKHKLQCSITYKEFRRDTLRLGTALCSMKLNDKHIACIGNNSYLWLVTYLTMLNSNGVFVPIDKELPENDIVNVLNHSDSTVVFCSEKHEKIITENIDKLQNIKHIFSLGNTQNANTVSIQQLLDLGEKLLSEGNTEYLNLIGDTNALRVLVYTSGTTGMAKGVMLSEKNIASCIYHGMRVSSVSDRSLSVLPYHHTYEACGLLASIHKHATICINENLFTVLKNLNKYKPEFMYLVPAFLESFHKKILSVIGKKAFLVKLMICLSNLLRKFGVDIRRKMFKSIIDGFGGKLQKIVCGGAPLRAETAKFFDDIGISVVNGYGISECSPLVAITRDNVDDCKTSGAPIPCVQIKLSDIDADGIGEICVKGDSVMLGYYKNTEQTDEVLKDGWFYTGDYGKIDKYNRVQVTGRKKNLIVLKNGKNIFPEEIENYIQSIPYVAEVVVYAYKEKDGTESCLHAQVYLNDKLSKDIQNVEDRLNDDVKEALKNLPKYKRIQKIIINDEEFVKTTSKKIKRNLVVNK